MRVKDEKKEKNKDDEHVVDKVERHARLWLADGESGALSSLVMAPWRFESVAWLPSGDRLVAVANMRLLPEVYESKADSVRD